MIQGVKLKQRREAVGLTQQELADQLCVTVQAVSQWENGRTQPDSDRILLLAKLLKTTADALLDEAQTGVAPWQLTDQMFSEEHMYSKLKAFAQAEGLTETYRALPYMRSCHAGQTRKPGLGVSQAVPYIVHPLTMACQAHAMGIREDSALAAALLHDVCEDCNIAPEDLPFSAPVKAVVSLLTKNPERFWEVGRSTALAEYYSGIQGNQTAMFVKALDRCSNLSTMATSFSSEKMARYITETEEYILPLLEEIKRRYPDWNDAAFLLKYQILSLLETQKALMMKYHMTMEGKGNGR